MFNSKSKNIINARKINKMRCIAGLAICALVIVLTSVAIILNVTNYYEEASAEAGTGTFRMFTTLSNIIAAIAASICIPFQIDGLRKDKYNLPFWIITVMYVGVVGVFITFFVALTIISALQGFSYAMFGHSNLFMHTINPIFITISFTLIISDHHIKFKEVFLSITPMLIYSLIYFIMVFVVKAWSDHYQTNSFIPWPVSFIIILSVAFGCAVLLRYLHNLTNKFVTKSIERYYKESDDFKFNTITDAIAHLAEIESKFYYEGDDIYIPVDIIALLSERYETSKLPLDIQYDIYLERYLLNIKKKSGSKK